RSELPPGLIVIMTARIDQYRLASQLPAPNSLGWAVESQSPPRVLERATNTAAQGKLLAAAN
ncbi:MAG: hypothetical protein ACYDBH_22900, partial [Acidobacteriaceae bacterium]